MSTLMCRVCGDTTRLEDHHVVSEAQIVAFVDAHYLHASMSIYLR